MINGEIPERKHDLTARAFALLFPKQRMLMRPVIRQLAQIGSVRYVDTVRHRMLREQKRVVLFDAYLHQLRRLRRQIDSRPLAVQTLRGDACGRAAAERIQNRIAFVRGRLDDPLQQRDRLLRGISDPFLRPGFAPD